MVAFVLQRLAQALLVMLAVGLIAFALFCWDRTQRPRNAPA